MRLLLMCATWTLGQLLASAVPLPLAELVVPAALATLAYLLTEDLGRPRVAHGDGKYWRGRRIDDDRPGRDRLN